MHIHTYYGCLQRIITLCSRHVNECFFCCSRIPDLDWSFQGRRGTEKISKRHLSFFLLSHTAGPQFRLVVIIIFLLVVRPSFCPYWPTRPRLHLRSLFLHMVSVRPSVCSSQNTLQSYMVGHDIRQTCLLLKSIRKISASLDFGVGWVDHWMTLVLSFFLL